MKKPPDQNSELNHLMAGALRHLTSGVLLTGPYQDDSPILYVNPAFSSITGYSESEVLGRNCRFLQGPETDKAVVQAMREAIQSGVAFKGLVQNYRKDGTPFLNALIITPMLDDEGEITSYVGTINDVSTSREQLRALASHATRAREAERTSIAREIHDELGQALTALKMDLAWMDRRVKQLFEQMDATAHSAQENQLHERTRAMITLTEDTINTVRRIATQLRPALLDDLGLEAAVEWQVKDFAARTGLVCDFKSSLGEREMSPAVATAGFRILQEALTNIARHAQASRVRVRLDANPDGLHLEVSDNGVGIKPQELATVRSLGLLGMSERALSLGGTVNITRNKPKGTKVCAQIPLSQPTSLEDEQKA